VVCYRPRNVLELMQTDHFEIAVTTADRRVDVRRSAQA